MTALAAAAVTPPGASPRAGVPAWTLIGQIADGRLHGLPARVAPG
jgi:hypothetical protein